MLIVLADARFDPAQADEVAAIARPMIEASRAEAGCAGYDYTFDMLEPGLMRVREWWKDEQALKDHFATTHAEVGDHQVPRARPGAADAEHLVLIGARHSSGAIMSATGVARSND